MKFIIQFHIEYRQVKLHDVLFENALEFVQFLKIGFLAEIIQQYPDLYIYNDTNTFSLLLLRFAMPWP